MVVCVTVQETRFCGQILSPVVQSSPGSNHPTIDEKVAGPKVPTARVRSSFLSLKQCPSLGHEHINLCSVPLAPNQLQGRIREVA